MPKANRGARPASIATPASERSPRADAVANRARLLAVAAVAFDEDGVDVPLDEIARRAGLGAGTLHRHFPTKAALIDATLAERVTELTAEVQAQTRAADPTAALLGALAVVVERGAASHALADRLRAASGDIDAAVAAPVAQLRTALATLLRRAQRAGGIRRDLDAAGLDAVLAAAHALQVHPGGGAPLVAMLLEALRTSAAPLRR